MSIYFYLMLSLFTVPGVCGKVGPTTRFINSLKVEEIDKNRYSKLKSNLMHVQFDYLEEKIFTNSHLYVNLTDWISAVDDLSDMFLINTKWLEEFKTLYQQIHTIQCNGSLCNFHMINMAIEGSGLLHSFGIFGVKLKVDCQMSDSLFRSKATENISLLRNEIPESELDLVDINKIEDFMLVKSYLLLAPAINGFLNSDHNIL